MPLPILDHRDAILAAIGNDRRLILTSPTGSGKSTQVPQYIIDRQPEFGGVLVLQPRRLAARMLATRVAEERDQQPGGEIGFITRFEHAVGAYTRITYVTDGILLRRLQDDPLLEGIGTIIFDEFHERSVNADLGLAMIRHLQEKRTDLRLIVMSATLDTRILIDYLPGSNVLAAEGRQYPVDISYLPGDNKEAPWDKAIRALRQLLATPAQGDILIFMPGAHEIRRTIELCRNLKSAERLVCLPLYSNLPPEQQAAAMQPVDGRKIVVATNIAETSLTIDGVRHVIDSGLARINRYDAARGFNMLQLEPTSKFSADQRAGRAGRQAPGTCIRLWSRHQQDSRPPSTEPEIRRVDLAEPLLQLRTFGFRSLDKLPLLETPTPTAVQIAEQELRQIGAIDRQTGELTQRGRALVRYPAHPRLACLMLEAGRRGVLADAAMIAAILSEAPVYATRKGGFQRVIDFAGKTERDGLASDFFPLLDALEHAHHVRFDRQSCEDAGIYASPARQVWRTRDYFLAIARREGLQSHQSGCAADLLKSLLLAFPEHLAKRRDKGTLLCDLSDGRRAELARESTLRQAELLVAGECREISGPGTESRVLLTLVSEVPREWLDELFPDEWEIREEPVWDIIRKVVDLHVTIRCLGLVLENSRSPEVSEEIAAAMLADLVRKEHLQLRGWDKDVKAWIERVRWLADIMPDHGLITYDETEVDLIVHEICAGERSYAGIRTKPCLPYVKNALTWKAQQFVEEMAPERIMLPSGRRMQIDYVVGQTPRGRARIQDLYGLDETPSIAGGRVKLLIEIQAPNMRAVQITDDLRGFWANLYPELRKQLSKRYPKHEWR